MASFSTLLLLTLVGVTTAACHSLAHRTAPTTRARPRRARNFPHSKRTPTAHAMHASKHAGEHIQHTHTQQARR
jgi:hypothetical protein